MELMETIAPKDLAENWDNVGLQVGDEEKEVKKILIALDATMEVIEEAIKKEVDLIVTHHPFLLFKKIETITKQDVLGKKIYALIENEIAVLSAHTNLDIVSGGINDILAKQIGLIDGSVLEITNSFTQDGIGRIGHLKEVISFETFVKQLKETFAIKETNIGHFVGAKEKQVQKVAVCGGSGVSLMQEAHNQGADVLVTGDLKFHEAQTALDLDLCIADITHYASEAIVVPMLFEKFCAYRKEQKVELEILQSEVNGQVFWN